MNGIHNRQPERQNTPEAPRPQRPRLEFRIAWILVPLVCLGVLWVFRNIHPAFTWSDVMGWLGVHNTARYTKLATLGLLLIGIVIMRRIFRRDN